MDTRTANGSFKHLGIFDGVAQSRVHRSLSVTQLRSTLDGVGQIHLQPIGQAIGDSPTKGIGDIERHFLYTRYILDGVLRGHRGIGDDMRAVLVAVLVLHPLQHSSSSIVIEVGIDIGQRDTVGVQETLEQQVILQGVNLGDSQTVGHHRAGCRATTWTDHHTQFVASGIDKVLYYQEVARETHRLHDVQLEAHAVINLRRNGLTIALLGASIGEFSQIVSLELDAVQFVVAAQLLDFLLTIFTRQRVLAVLIAGKLLIELLLGELLAPFLLRTERFGNGEEGHDGVVIQTVDLYLI